MRCLTVVVLIILELAESDRTGGRHPVVTATRSVAAALTTPVVFACALPSACNLMSLWVPETVLPGVSFAGQAVSPVGCSHKGLNLGGSTLLAGRYGGDLGFAGSVVVKTTFVALHLLPIWTAIVM